VTSVSLNFDGVEPAEPWEPLEDGQYNFTIIDAKIQPNKETADLPESDPDKKPPTLAMTLMPVDFPNNKVWHYLYLGTSDQNLRYILQFILALSGGERPEGELVIDAEFAAGIINSPLLATVEKAERNDKKGKFTNKVTSFDVMPF
jgi:hypothetical protein